MDAAAPAGDGPGGSLARCARAGRAAPVPRNRHPARRHHSARTPTGDRTNPQTAGAIYRIGWLRRLFSHDRTPGRVLAAAVPAKRGLSNRLHLVILRNTMRE